MEFLVLNFNFVMVVMFVLFLILYWKFSFKVSKYSLLLEVGGVWFIMGYFYFMGGGLCFLYIILVVMVDKYGLVFMIWFGVYKILVVSSWELVKELFIIWDVIVFLCLKFFVVKYMGYDFVMFLFFFYGIYWCELCKLMVVELFFFCSLEFFKYMSVLEIEVLLINLFKSLSFYSIIMCIYFNFVFNMLFIWSLDLMFMIKGMMCV